MALMTALTGGAVLNENYVEKPIVIAFNPLANEEEEHFAVQTPAHVNDKRWIPDISVVFDSTFSSYKFVNEYISKNPTVEPEVINAAIDNLRAIQNVQLGTIKLVPELNISEVTEIFVRINSKGTRLNEADFAMSKIAADELYNGKELRKAIDYFCHVAVNPSFYEKILLDHDFVQSNLQSKIKWIKDGLDDIYTPDYSDMLRVSYMHKFNRGRLRDLVSILSGRDFKDKVFKGEIAEDGFSKLTEGVVNFVNEYNFKNFILAIKSAGFIEAKLLNSNMTLDFAYTLYLILNNDVNVKKSGIKRLVQKWFVFSTLTSRYVGSPESQMDRDLRGIVAKGTEQFIREAEATRLSDQFWEGEVKHSLETSATNSPYFNVFLAAQIYFKDTSLLSKNEHVGDLVTIVGDVHHIFPKAYLKKNGITSKVDTNQVANYTYLASDVNKSIADRAPEDYFDVVWKQCNNGDLGDQKPIEGVIDDLDELKSNLAANCIPDGIRHMTVENYAEFLDERRSLMAQKIKQYYEAL